MDQRYFICACCHDTFEKIRTDEEAMNETIQTFGEAEIVGQDLSVVCDDCYHRMVRAEQDHIARMAELGPLYDIVTRYMAQLMANDIIGTDHAGENNHG